VCPYDEIFSASDRNSFFFFRPARFVRESSVSKTRRHIAAIPRAEMIIATHQWSGMEEEILVRKFMDYRQNKIGCKKNTSQSASREDYEGVVLFL
jgi:hypothetical protein